MKKKHLHTLVVLLLVVSLLVSSLGAASAETTFTPDVYDVCASVLAASGLTFNNTAAYRSAGQRFYEYLQTHDTSSMSAIDAIAVRVAENITEPFRVSTGLISCVRTWFSNFLTDDAAHIVFKDKFVNDLDFFKSLTFDEKVSLYAVSSIRFGDAKRYSRFSDKYELGTDAFRDRLKQRGWWQSYGTYLGRIGCVDAFFVTFYYDGYGTFAHAFFCENDYLGGVDPLLRFSSSLFNWQKDNVYYYACVPYYSDRFQSEYKLTFRSSSDSQEFPYVSKSVTVPFGSEHDNVNWVSAPRTTTIDYNSDYSSPDTAQGITIDTLIYMPTYNEVSDTQLAAPITPDSVRSDSGGTDPEPKPEPKPDPGTEPEESVINKIYNFIVPILGEIKAGISDLIDAVAKIPAKIGDLLGGIGDDLAGLAAFLPTLLGILTGYTLFVSLFSHFLPEPVYLTVYAFFVATIVVYLIRWVANR